MRFLKKVSFILCTVTLFIFACHDVQAQESCGEVVSYNEYGDGPVEERAPISNCDNIFNADEPAPFAATLQLNGQPVSEGSTITLPAEGEVVGEFSLEVPGNNFVFEPLHLYRKVGNDQYFEFATREQQFSIIDLPEGEYTAVFQYAAPPVLSQHNSFLKQILSKLFLPNIAYAASFPSYVQIVTLSFTVAHEQVAPAGASSILFLPGIMGSHLYEASEVCVGSDEQQRWFSHTDCEQLRLLTNADGVSVNDIYTKPTENAIVDETLGFNLYKSFLSDLSDWKEENIISDYAAVPYDWRLRLGDVLKTKQVDEKVVFDKSSSYQDSYIYQNLTELVASSKSGKVTVVAHSNGGLLIKELLAQMENADDFLLPMIDTIIFVGVPQAGTPESLISFLHGSTFGPAGTIVSQETTRRLINNMPFAYHLLPSESYFDLITTPVITIENGTVTGPWSSIFPPDVTNRNRLERFLTAEGTRNKPVADDLLQPEIASAYLLEYSRNAHIVQETWRPPTTTKVHQVAGVGVSTPSNITYFTDQKCVKRNVFTFFLCAEYEPGLAYRVSEVSDGDGTVLTPSAVAMSEGNEVKSLWLDLEEYNNDVALDRVHKDLFEVEEVRNYVLHTIQSTKGSYEYLATTTVDLPAEDKLVFQLHSPLDMQVFTDEGELSSSTVSIVGGKYRRYGELQYISIPKTSGTVTVILTGVASGSFTFEVEDWQDGEMNERTQFQGVPSDSGTVVTYELKTGESSESLKIDFDGDGVIDGEINVDGEVTDFNPMVTEEVATVERRNTTSSTRVASTPTAQVLGVATLPADAQYRAELYTLLIELSRLLDLLNKHSYEK